MFSLYERHCEIELTLISTQETTDTVPLTWYAQRYKRETEGGRSFGVRSTRIWNDLPSFLKESPNVHSLKRDFTNIYFASFKAIDTFRVFI